MGLARTVQALETEKAKLKVSNLAAVVARVLETLGNRIDPSGARFSVGFLPTVAGDSGQLESLFQNLLGNALKYQPPGQRPMITLDARWEAPHWHLTVADNGIGIAPRHAERVFVIFQRLHRGDAYEGTGIGLAVCRKIVQRHGGRIWVPGADVDTGNGTGSVFHIKLPAPEA